MIEMYKILNGGYDSKSCKFVRKQNDVVAIPGRTRGHNDKIYTEVPRRNSRRFTFVCRVVDPWNSLPEKVVKSSTINTFKKRLDAHWGDDKINTTTK